MFLTLKKKINLNIKNKINPYSSNIFSDLI